MSFAGAMREVAVYVRPLTITSATRLHDLFPVRVASRGRWWTVIVIAGRQFCRTPYQSIQLRGARALLLMAARVDLTAARVQPLRTAPYPPLPGTRPTPPAHPVHRGAVQACASDPPRYHRAMFQRHATGLPLWPCTARTAASGARPNRPPACRESLRFWSWLLLPQTFDEDRYKAIALRCV